MNRQKQARVVWCFAVILICTLGFVCNVYAVSTSKEKQTQVNELGTTKKHAKKLHLKISRTQLDVKLDGEKVLRVSGGTGKYKWESSNKDVVSVKKDGSVKGKSCGKATITVTSGSQKVICKVTVYATKKHLSEWVESKGRYYYFDKYGQKVTGKKKINGKEYYFDDKCRQRTGWLKVGKSYYFYNIGRGKNGYMVKNGTVNQIKLQKDGKAKVKDSNKMKLKSLVYSNDIVFENRDWTMSRSDALKKLFVGFAGRKDRIIVYRNIGGFKKGDGWPERYALIYLENGYGDCYVAGCAFAYLAVALGYDDVYAQSSGGHGWCKIDGKYYDPNWAWWGTKNMFNGYAVPESLSGKGGRQSWKGATVYSVKIS